MNNKNYTPCFFLVEKNDALHFNRPMYCHDFAANTYYVWGKSKESTAYVNYYKHSEFDSFLVVQRKFCSSPNGAFTRT